MNKGRTIYFKYQNIFTKKSMDVFVFKTSNTCTNFMARLKSHNFMNCNFTVLILSVHTIPS